MQKTIDPEKIKIYQMSRMPTESSMHPKTIIEFNGYYTFVKATGSWLGINISN